MVNLLLLVKCIILPTFPPSGLCSVHFVSITTHYRTIALFSAHSRSFPFISAANAPFRSLLLYSPLDPVQLRSIPRYSVLFCSFPFVLALFRSIPFPSAPFCSFSALLGPISFDSVQLRSILNAVSATGARTLLTYTSRVLF